MAIIRVCDYIRRKAGREICVLKVGENLKCLDAKYTRKIRHYISTRSARVVGIYNHRVPEEWIMEDMERAGAV